MQNTLIICFACRQRLSIEMMTFPSFQITEVWTNTIGYISFALTKDSPYRVFMNRAIKKLQESRKIEKIRKKWAIPQPDCSPNQEIAPLGIEKVISLMFIMVVGILLSFILMFSEKIIHFKGSKNLSQNILNNEGNQMKLKEIKRLLASKRKTDMKILSLLKE